MYIVVTPVSLSPFSTDHWIGAAPLYLGRSDAWTFTQPYWGISNISFGNIFPYATTHIISGFKDFISFINSSFFFTFSGWNTGKFFSIANSLTGVAIIFIPLPFGLSTFVTTAKMSCPALYIASNESLAKSGVPIKTIFIFITFLPIILIFLLLIQHNFQLSNFQL